MVHDALMESFWKRVNRAGDDACWEWTSCKLKGRGIFKYKGVTKSCPRWSWEIHHGPIPDGLYVLHTCDNPACVNPRHLFLGTQTDNMLDMKTKGRSHKPLGELNGRCKTTLDVVLEIKKHLASGLKPAKVRDLGFDYSLVSQIKSGKNWSHVTLSSEES